MEVRDSTSCACAACGVACGGRFQGCATVWSLGTTALPTAAEPDVDFPALPYVGTSSPPVVTGYVEFDVPAEATATDAPPGADAAPSLQVALVLQQAVNEELLEAIRRLEATVAELTAAPAPTETPVAPAPALPSPRRRGRAVDVLQWVEGGVRPAHPAERPATTIGEASVRPSRPALRRPPRRRIHRR